MPKKSIHHDTYLIERLQSGDTSVLNDLVKTWHKLFCEKSFWIVKDKDVAKDIAQESWITIINKINTLENPKYFKSWVYRIVINKSTDYLRQVSNKQLINRELDTNIEKEDNSNRERLKQDLLKAIKDLSYEQTLVIQLYYSQDYNLKEISEILDVSLGTVKSRLFHAREKLKTILKAKHYED
ncbi:MAG: RNA polymerase sigma factor [Winogradskyella sp.]|uniref:RNA polymerase sigma factor n=1 Tax=Winogradskyella sp. TaxID=1883156 RepID=UPI000F3BCD3D|nr:RNA polymerase sigma factor [Winogradskyella sp.]RNC87115.1 MAG: RNA polymerase sigma factor [Winogradskyella sp.]